MDWAGVSGVGARGSWGQMSQYICQRPPVKLHYTCPIYHSLYSNWEGFKDSSISADSGHERVGMMGEGRGGGAHHQGALAYIQLSTVGIPMGK